MQLPLFQSYLDPIKLKEGKAKCPCCERSMKAFGYSLNESLIEYAGYIYDYCEYYKTNRFRSKDITPDHKFLSQFQKLKMFGIIRREKKSSYWVLTRVGKSFMQGRTVLPEKVWMFNNKVILESDEVVNVGQAKRTADWKKCSLDWTLDYVLRDYKSELKVKELSL